MIQILLVDDDADDREIFCDALHEVAPEAGCFAKPNGKEAFLSLERKEIVLPDVIFLDINMPVMNGWQCLEALKSSDVHKDIPVIMYSTSSHPEEVSRARHMGALCFFSKPSDFNRLKKYLERVVAHLQNGTLSSIRTVFLMLSC